MKFYFINPKNETEYKKVIEDNNEKNKIMMGINFIIGILSFTSISCKNLFLGNSNFGFKEYPRSHKCSVGSLVGFK